MQQLREAENEHERWDDRYLRAEPRCKPIRDQWRRPIVTRAGPVPTAAVSHTQREIRNGSQLQEQGTMEVIWLLAVRLVVRTTRAENCRHSESSGLNSSGRNRILSEYPRGRKPERWKKFSLLMTADQSRSIWERSDWMNKVSPSTELRVWARALWSLVQMFHEGVFRSGFHVAGVLPRCNNRKKRCLGEGGCLCS